MTAIEPIERILATSRYSAKSTREAGNRINGRIEAAANERISRINAMAATDCMIAITKMNALGKLSANEILAELIGIMEIADECQAEMSEK